MTESLRKRGNPVVVLTGAGTAAILFGANLHAVHLASSVWMHDASEVGWPFVWGISVSIRTRSETSVISLPGLIMDLAVALIVTAAMTYTVMIVIHRLRTRQFLLIDVFAAVTAVAIALSVTLQTRKFAFPIRQTHWTVDDFGTIYASSGSTASKHSFMGMLTNYRAARFEDFYWMPPAIFLAAFVVPFAGTLWIHGHLHRRQVNQEGVS
jgi:hypothetical protein